MVRKKSKDNPSTQPEHTDVSADSTSPWMRELWNAGIRAAEEYRRNTGNPEDFISQQVSPTLKEGALTGSFKENVRQVAKELDANGNGIIGMGELDRVILDPAAQGDRAAMAYAFKSNWSILNTNWGGLTQQRKERLELAADIIKQQGPILQTLGAKALHYTAQRYNVIEQYETGSTGLDNFLKETKKFERYNSFAQALENNADELTAFMLKSKLKHKQGMSLTQADLEKIQESGKGWLREAKNEFEKKYRGSHAGVSAFYVQSHFNDFSSNGKEISPDDIVARFKERDNIENNMDQYSPEARGKNASMWRQLEDQYLNGKDHIKAATDHPNLYSNKNNPLENIRPEAVHQNNIGSCYVLGGLAALAHSNPQAIKDMINYDESSKKYSVKFPGLPQPISVDRPTNMELARYNLITEHGIWPAIIQKAYAKHTNDTPSFRDGALLWRTNIDQDSLDMGGDGIAGLHFLTGKGGKTFAKDLSTSEMENHLQNGLTEHQPIIYRTPKHVAAVIGYDKQSKTVKLYDQARWEGTNYSVSLDEFKKMIVDFHIGDK